MAKIELPFRAFTADFMRRAFPNRDFSRGSALEDLVVKASAALLQPLRHEIDAIKVNQSITNYPYMTREALDRLAANWGKFRQNGGHSVGTVRLFFSAAVDYQLNYLEFFASDGSTFVLQAPVRISALELMRNRQGDSTFYAEVAVTSVGVGSRYALAAGSLTGVRNPPTGLVRVENPTDFAVTAPDESNFDVVNTMFRNIGLRNLISRQAIRAPLFENFPGLLDIYVAAADDAKMVRDLVTVRVGSTDIELHLGGMADVWLNTTSVGEREVTFSYLPSSQRLRVVSAAQAAAAELLYSFSRALLTVEGEYSAPDHGATVLDESTGIVFDQAGLARLAFLLTNQARQRYHVAARDLVSGLSLFAQPVPFQTVNTSPYFVDITDINLRNAGVAIGDTLRLGATRIHRVTNRVGRVIEVAPGAADLAAVASFTFDDNGGASPVTLGARFIPRTNLLSLSPAPRLNDRIVIPNSPAAGHYRLLALDSAGLWCGNVLAEGALLFVSTVAGVNTYTFTGPAAAAAELPLAVDATCWVHFDVGGAYDQTSVQWAKILTVTRVPSGIRITTTGGLTGALDLDAVSIVQGLAGALTTGQPVYFERDSTATAASSSLLPFDKGHTVYVNALDVDFLAGTATLRSPGIGVAAAKGHVVVFDIPVPDAFQVISGGDGSRFTALVDNIAGPDEITLVPSPQFTLPRDTRYAVIRNPGALATLSPSVVDATARTITVPAFPLGLGDGTGLVISATETVTHDDLVTPTNLTVVLSLCTTGRPYSVIALTATPNLSRVRAGDTMVIVGTALGVHDGSFLVHSVSDAGDTVTIVGSLPTTPLVGTATFIASRLFAVVASTGGTSSSLRFEAPRSAIVLTMSATEYTSLAPTHRNQPVRQVIGGATHAGVLWDYNNTAQTWTVLPNNPASDTFATFAASSVKVDLPLGAASARITSVGAPALVGYYTPLSSDIGKLVRQGSYTGILDGFDDSLYTWVVRPSTEFDRFDSVTQYTFVDRDNTGERVVSPSPSAFGKLREPGTQPVVNLGTATLTLDRLPMFKTTTVLSILSRFGRGGAFFDGTKLRVLNLAGVNDGTNLAGITVLADTKLLLPTGANYGEYDITAKDTYTVTAVSALGADAVSIANGPGEQTLALTAAVSQGATVLGGTGLRLGLFGHAGRVLKLRVGTQLYWLAIAGPSTVDDVVLIDPVPVPLYPTQKLTVEVVDAFVSPFLALAKAGLFSYRFSRPPVIGEVLNLGATGNGSQSAAGAANTLSDGTKDFDARFGYLDFTAGDVHVHLDGGPDAALTSRDLTAVSYQDTLEVSGVFSATAAPIGYHVSVRPTVDSRLEGWFRGVVIDANEVWLDVPNGWAPLQYGTLRGFSLTIAKHAGTAASASLASFELIHLPIAAYNVATKIATLDLTAARVGQPAVAGLFDPLTGFNAALFGQWVRVAPRRLSRVMAQKVDGNVLQSFNYYVGAFFTLPVVRILAVQQLDPANLQPVKDLPYTLIVNDKGRRYSADEDLDIEVTDASAILQPVRVTYLADGAIETVNSFLNDADTRVVNANYLAKRMETIAVDLSLRVRSTRAVGELTTLLAGYINTLPAATRLSKDGIIKYLYEQQAVTFVDTDTMRLDGTYYQLDGVNIVNSDVSDIFGSATACYLSSGLAVTKMGE